MIVARRTARIEGPCAYCASPILAGQVYRPLPDGRAHPECEAPRVTWLRMLPLRAGQSYRRWCRLYRIWSCMRVRCKNPKSISYQWYGAHGIKVCAEWDNDYAVFRAWAVSHGYRKGLTLDRIDPARDYEPANCRWSTPKEQQWNTNRAIRLTVNGITKSLPEWAHERGIEPGIFRNRRREGWTDEQIVLTPLGGQRPGYVPRKRGPKPKSAHVHGYQQEPRT